MNHTGITPAIARGVLALRERIEACEIPPSRLDETMTIATWNIREFGRRKRREDSLHYIAEIIGQFDLVAIVELREDLTELERVLELLGPTWRAVFTAPLFDQGGNRERSAYLYDERVVAHTGLGSEAQAPRTKRGAEYLSAIDWWRPPFLASFRSGDAELLLVTAHIRWGGAHDEVRLPELKLLSQWIALELARDPYVRERELIVLGDFNIPSVESPLFREITKHGLMMPKALLGTHGSNLAKNKRYDQILHLPTSARSFTGKGGVLDFYTGGIRALYPRGVDERQFTYELSDHLPLWIEIASTASAANLARVARRR